QVPEAHFLEAWSDARAYDGTASVIQPLIAPLYGGKSAHEVLAALSDRPERSGYDIVRDYWRERAGGADFEVAWRRRLHEGLIPNTAFPPGRVSVVPSLLNSVASGFRGTSSSATPSGLEIAFRNDPTVLDGRFANNGWLQELPKPITKLTWDNAILVGPATADRLKLRGSPSYQGGEHGQIVSDLVDVRYRGRTIRGAAFVVVGHPE